MMFLRDPNELEPLDGEGILQVVVETPAGSRGKVSYDPERRVFVMKKLLPAGMAFSHDFGFLPRTRGGDGDALDVLVLSETPGHPGCVIPSRLVGAFEAEQEEGERRVRNDVLIAVASFSQLYGEVREADELPQRWTEEMQAFFEQYHRLEGKPYRVRRVRDAAGADELLRQAREAAAGEG